jgi:5-deoxy-glucuronate isomerase
MPTPQLLFRPRVVGPEETGVLIELAPKDAGWEHLHFSVRRIARGDGVSGETGADEACLVLLSGSCRVSWNGGAAETLGPRESVFEAYPHAVYLPPDARYAIEAAGTCEIAEGRAPARRALPARIVRPAECGLEVRGGGNATRQIIDILPPDFPADRLLCCEVLTPSGNWSSYPPHKHDRDDPPREVELEETYYYRIRGVDGYGFQRLYTGDGRLDQTLKVEDGDLVLVREGYHPFVTAFGYDAYYLNFLAGERRSMAAADDPRYAALRRSWPAPDPRVPLVPRPSQEGA